MVSTLSLSVEDLQVVVRIDGEDISRADDNAGADPWYSLVPVNRFVATDEITTATVACCPDCGPECVDVFARIRREAGLVSWDWGRGGPQHEGERRRALFDAAAYDAEVARIGDDHRWETPMHRAGRLIFTGLDLPAGVVARKILARGSDEIEVWLEQVDEYQIFVTLPWDAERPDESAAAARAVLVGPTPRWPATWHSIRGDRDNPVAG